MKKKIILMSAATISSLLCFSALNAQAGNNDKISKSFDYEGFSEIEIAGVYNLDVKVGGDFGIDLSGREKEMKRVEVEMKGDTLILSQKKRKGWGGNQKGIDAVITLPVLSEIEVSGVVDGAIDGVDSENFVVEVSGVGDLEISGRCGNLDASVSGVGDLDAKKFECKNVEISLAGVGDATVFASEAVDASVSGVGDIDVYGAPKSVEKSGGMFSDISVH